MLFVENFNTDPYCNHALEEWLIENHSDDCFILWRNQKAVLLGKNQNVHNEINMGRAKTEGVKIVRRITGGGTVYTDEGSIMFTFISCDRSGLTNFREFTEPILSALKSLNIPAEFMGRNDLTIKGGKFSGNAQCTYRGKLLHHGTLMYETNISDMEKILQINELKLRDKGVASVRSRVTNISEHMENAMSIEEFHKYLFNSVMESSENPVFYRLSEAEWESVRIKATEKHNTNKWIYGRSPVFNVKREAKLPGGMLQIYLSVVNGYIEAASIFGDFFGDKDVSELENAITQIEFNPYEIRKALANFSICEYLYNISLDEFINVIGI